MINSQIGASDINGFYIVTGHIPFLLTYDFVNV